MVEAHVIGHGGAAAAQVDHALGDPLAREIRGELARGDLRSMTYLFRHLERGPWEDRYFYADVLLDAIPILQLENWCRSDANTASPFLLRGLRGLAAAHSATAGPTPSPEAMRLYHARLVAAEQDLLHAARMCPLDPTPYAYLISVAMAGRKGLDATERWFLEAMARDPFHQGAHQCMLGNLTQKWQGTHDRMFRFARTNADRSPEGSELKLLLVRAHVERWLHHASFDGDPRAAERYLTDPVVRRDAEAAYEHSLGSPAHETRRTTVYARNLAAFWFYLIRDPVRLGQELARLGNAVGRAPWCYRFGDPAEALASARRLATGSTHDVGGELRH